MTAARSSEGGATTRPGGRSIRTRLILTFSLLFAGVLTLIQTVHLLGVPVGDYPGLVSIRRAESRNMLDLVADLKKDRLERWLAECRSDVAFFASNKMIRQQVAALTGDADGAPREGEPVGGPGEQAALENVTRYLREILRDYPTYIDASVVDANTGQILAGTRAHVARGVEEDEAALRLADGALEPIRTDPRTGLNTLRIAHTINRPSAPPNGSSPDARLAMLVLVVDTEDIIRPLIHTGEGLGTTGEALLVDSDARILTGLAFPLANGSRAKVLEHQIQARPAQLAAAGNEGQIEADDYRGIPVIASYRHIAVNPDGGWGLVVKRDAEELDAPVRREVLFTIGLSLLGLLAIVLSTIALAGSLTEPLRNLTNAAKRLAEGDLGARSNIHRRDEVGVLASAFDALAEQSQRTLEGLSTKTRELRVANEQLAVRDEMLTAVLSAASRIVRASEVDVLAREALAALMENTRSQAGAIYLLGDEGDLSLVHTAGLSDATRMPKRVSADAGILGAAGGQPGVSVLRDIAPDTRYVIRNLAGDAVPSCLIDVPLLWQEQVVGLVTLASLFPVREHELEGLELSRTTLGVATTNALAHAETRRLASNLQSNNEELTVLNEELLSANEELRAQAQKLATQTSRLEEQRVQVEEANRLKSEFLSNMSHELRTPLNSVLALVQLLLERGTGKDTAKEAEYLTVIERNGRNLLSLINDILDLSKIEAGRMDIVPALFHPSDVARRAIETVRPAAEAKGLSLNLEIGEVPPMVSDSGRIRQILLNLLSNAVKFTHSGGVDLSVWEEAGTVCFGVRDTGVGIDSEFRDRLFEPFRQADGSTTRRHEGTGLGLSIALRLARLLGGEIDLETRVGAGSTFTLRLPRECPGAPVGPGPSRDVSPARQARTSESAGTRDVDRPRRATQRVLVVEDNDVAMLQIRTALEGAGLTVQLASGGAAAIEAAHRDVPDAVVLDLMMPGVDGFEVLEEIRSSPQTREIPVLVLTAKELTAAERARLTKSGVRELVQKGALDREELLARVGALLAPRARRSKAPEPTRRPATGRHSRLVVVVEDNADNRFTLAQILESGGFQHQAAIDGEEGIRMVKRLRPGLVLMDLQLPELSGEEALRRIREDAEIGGTPVVAITARAMKGDREQCLEVGFDDHLPKPLDPERVLAAVRKWLG